MPEVRAGYFRCEQELVCRLFARGRGLNAGAWGEFLRGATTPRASLLSEPLATAQRAVPTAHILVRPATASVSRLHRPELGLSRVSLPRASASVWDHRTGLSPSSTHSDFMNMNARWRPAGEKRAPTMRRAPCVISATPIANCDPPIGTEDPAQVRLEKMSSVGQGAILYAKPYFSAPALTN